MNKNTTILVADDELEVREMIQRFLAKRGFESILAADGREALGRAKIRKPDLILLDVNMPKMDGMSVCRELRENPSTALTPVLMLTARGDVADRVQGLNTGADDYLCKPFDLMELAARIEALLKRSQKVASCNPLTNLPGSSGIQAEIEARMAANEKFGVAHIDIDYFKPYNDSYGHHQGDQVILWTAQMMQKVIVQRASMSSCFLGHTGGDDFVLVASLENIEIICAEIAAAFDNHRRSWYNVIDSLKGGIAGRSTTFPFMTLSIGLVTNENSSWLHYGQVFQLAADVKRAAKARPDKNRSFISVDMRIV